MLDLSMHKLTIGIDTSSVEEWLKPVLDRGRGAAFLDTGFIRALIDQNDKKYHAIADKHFRQVININCYTTSFVLAEAIRQVTKINDLDEFYRAQWFNNCTQWMIESNRIYVCMPSRDVLIEAYRELQSVRLQIPKLDLCDALSICVLNHAKHKRVFGFDEHFYSFGASLEPYGA